MLLVGVIIIRFFKSGGLYLRIFNPDLAIILHVINYLSGLNNIIAIFLFIMHSNTVYITDKNKIKFIYDNDLLIHLFYL